MTKVYLSLNKKLKIFILKHAIVYMTENYIKNYSEQHINLQQLFVIYLQYRQDINANQFVIYKKIA